MSSRRPSRIAQQLREEIGPIVSYELRDNRVGFVTVTDVSVTPDLKEARVYVSFLGAAGDQAKSLAALNHAASFIRRELGERLRLRYTPQLIFIYDHSIERGARIEQLLSEEAARDTLAGDSTEQDDPPESD